MILLSLFSYPSFLFPIFLVLFQSQSDREQRDKSADIKRQLVLVIKS